MIWIIYAKDCAVADDNFATRIDNGALLLLLLCLLWVEGRASTNHSNRVAMELVDRHSNLPQRIAELLFSLSFNRDFYEGQCAVRHNGHHSDCYDQLDQRKSLVRRQSNAATSRINSAQQVAA